MLNFCPSHCSLHGNIGLTAVRVNCIIRSQVQVIFLIGILVCLLQLFRFQLNGCALIH